MLKHTAVSWLCQAGVRIEKAAEPTTTDTETLRRVHKHFNPHYLTDEVAILEGVLITAVIKTGKAAKG